MSFILDALKKAESERHRQSGPVLMDVRIAPPRRGLPAWMWVLGVVLLTNLGVLAWLLLRDPPTAAAPQMVATPPPSIPAPVAPPAPPPTPAANPVAAPPQAVTTPAADAFVVPPPALPPPAGADDSLRLPTVQDLQAEGVALPALQLNLHVYDPAVRHRYVMLNGVRLREGEFTPDGIKVERITERGVVLEASGRRFTLPAGY